MVRGEIKSNYKSPIRQKESKLPTIATNHSDNSLIQAKKKEETRIINNSLPPIKENPQTDSTNNESTLIMRYNNRYKDYLMTKEMIIKIQMEQITVLNSSVDNIKAKEIFLTMQQLLLSERMLLKDLNNIYNEILLLPMASNAISNISPFDVKQRIMLNDLQLNTNSFNINNDTVTIEANHESIDQEQPQITKSEYIELPPEEANVIKIQSVYRGYKVRKEL